jgi:purine-nucleoside phosphorylase
LAKKTISPRVDLELYNKIMEIAKNRGLSINATIDNAFSFYSKYNHIDMEMIYKNYQEVQKIAVQLLKINI